MRLSEETLFDLRIDPMQPSFSPGASLLVEPNLGLQLCNSTFGRAKLIRELLGHLERMLAVCFGYAGSFVKQLQNSLACFIELIRMTSNSVLRWKPAAKSAFISYRASSLIDVHPFVISWSILTCSGPAYAMMPIRQVCFVWRCGASVTPTKGLARPVRGNRSAPGELSVTRLYLFAADHGREAQRMAFS